MEKSSTEKLRLGISDTTLLKRHIVNLLNIHKNRRVVIAIVGIPGSGKSSLAMTLARSLKNTACLSMDGYHLSNAVLKKKRLIQYKGRIDTFDYEGFRSVIERLYNNNKDVYAHKFIRKYEYSLANELYIAKSVHCVIVEGNYLLIKGWKLSQYFTEGWYITTNINQVKERLLQRHIRFGRNYEEAKDWVDTVDMVNARFIIKNSVRDKSVYIKNDRYYIK